jgi:hypothetical protein
VQQFASSSWHVSSLLAVVASTLACRFLAWPCVAWLLDDTRAAPSEPDDPAGRNATTPTASQDRERMAVPYRQRPTRRTLDAGRCGIIDMDQIAPASRAYDACKQTWA